MGFDLASFVFLDRYRNEGTRTYSNQSGVTQARKKYRHNHATEQFDLPVFSYPRSEMNLYEANPPKTILDQYLKSDHAVFPVHPQILEAGVWDPYIEKTVSKGKPLPALRVCPSSSTRTLYVEGQNAFPHALKVHFPFRISRYDRKMRDEVVAQAVAVSGELEKGISSFEPGFSMMREVLGISHQNLDPGSLRGENWGFLVRDLSPFPHSKIQTRLIPGFALYGKDYFDPKSRAVLLDLVGDSPPVSFVLDHIMLPIVRQWCTCFSCFGFMLEPHGQNLILETDTRGNIIRTVHRDLSLGIDMRRRRDLNLSSRHLNGYNRMEDGAFASISYDRFMGSHFFDQIIACLQQAYPGLDKMKFSGPCREEFEKALPDHARYLPARVHYFSDTRDRYGKPFYRDTGQNPQYRP